MGLSSLGILLGAVGTLLASVNIVGGWLEKRRRGTVEERRLDIEGLQSLVSELRTSREADRVLIEAQGRKIVELNEQVDEMRKQRRRDQDQIDRLSVALEAVAPRGQK